MSDAPTITTSKPAKTVSRRNLVIGGVTAAAIVGGAYLVADRAGLDTLGTGGMNQRILPKVGEEAPDFVVPMLPDGEIVQLSALRGQPVWLNFWGSWCPPCRSEMPDIQGAWEELEPQGLVLLAVSLGEKPSEAWAFAQLNGATFPILTDPDRTLTGQQYPIYNFPTHIYIDREGIVQKLVLSEQNRDEAIENAQVIL